MTRRTAVVMAGAALVSGHVLAQPGDRAAAAALTGTAVGTGLTAGQLASSFGVNIHESYLDSTYVRDGPAPTLAALTDLGITRVRMGLAKRPRDYVAPFLRDLGRRGIRVLAVAGTPDGSWGTYATGDGALLADTLAHGYLKGRLAMVEMPNEWDANGGQHWQAHLQAFTSEFTAAIERVPGHPTIVAPSMARPAGYGASKLARFADVANTHPYSGDQMPESNLVLPLWVDSALTASRRRAVIASEIGWHTAPHAARAVSERVAGHYLIRSLIWNKTHGIGQSYVYELFDQRPDPAGQESELHYGLVAVTGDPADRSTWRQRPKPAYHQLKALIGRLRDPGRQAVRRLDYAFSDAPPDLFSTPIHRHDGAMDIAVWRRAALPTAGNAATRVRVRFDRPVQVTAFSTADGATRLITRSATQVTVQVSAAVRLLRVRPAP